MRVEILRGQTWPEVTYTPFFTFPWLKLILSQWSHLRGVWERFWLFFFDGIGFSQVFSDPCAKSSLWLAFFVRLSLHSPVRWRGKRCTPCYFPSGGRRDLPPGRYLSSWSSGVRQSQCLLGDSHHPKYCLASLLWTPTFIVPSHLEQPSHHHCLGYDRAQGDHCAAFSCFSAPTHYPRRHPWISSHISTPDPWVWGILMTAPSTLDKTLFVDPVCMVGWDFLLQSNYSSQVQF